MFLTENKSSDVYNHVCMKLKSTCIIMHMKLLFLAEHTTLHVHSFMLECAFKIPKCMTVVPMNPDSGNRIDIIIIVTRYRCTLLVRMIH